MDVRVGITDSSLESQAHYLIGLKTLSAFTTGVFHLPGQTKLAAKQGQLIVNGKEIGAKVLRLSTLEGKPFSITTLKRAGAEPTYAGQLEVHAVGNVVRLILIVDLESYVRGVLSSEIPASYLIDALKAQAVAARTYALNPRINHKPDGFDVCDSYLCCQYYAGLRKVSDKHQLAISETAQEVLTYDDKPILALFSSCAGGHTESYENCFSDPTSGVFPPAPLPYLKGVSEAPHKIVMSSEQELKNFWKESVTNTYDCWSPHFRWSTSFSDSSLEGHMHHIVEVLRNDKEFSKFITAPDAGVFGHIERFEINKRGIAGTAIELSVHTSKGVWLFTKELTIRSIFKNPELNLKRLPSARIILEHQYNNLGLLSQLKINGFGFGHGVGLQQVGAQGMAKLGITYKKILAHYYLGAKIQKLS